MKKMLLRSLAIVGCAAGASLASEYHVAQKNPAADDKNPGTADKPFKTINAAARRCEAPARRYALCSRRRVSRNRGIGWRQRPPRPAGSPYSHHRLAEGGRRDQGQRRQSPTGRSTTGSGARGDSSRQLAASNGKIYVKENWPHNTQQVFCDGKPLTQIAGYVGEGYIQEAGRVEKATAWPTWSRARSIATATPRGSTFGCRAATTPPSTSSRRRFAPVGISTCDLNYYDIAGFKVTHASRRHGRIVRLVQHAGEHGGHLRRLLRHRRGRIVQHAGPLQVELQRQHGHQHLQPRPSRRRLRGPLQ